MNTTLPLRLILGFVLASMPLFAQAPVKEPGTAPNGKVYTWTSENGLQYEYFVPKSYEPEAGANLTFILHGSNLDRRWGFANHEAGKFRASDIVVSPDGTSSNGNGGFNFLQATEDLEQMHALHAAIKGRFKIKQTFLYGHSQGSFFSFLYAGAYPDEVQGVVGQASGVWIGTRGGADHHHQAIVLMHGTADPVVPYSNSQGGLTSHFAKLEYPMARLRALDGWNHWPSQHHAEQQLAWCEGMTTEDPARLATCIEVLRQFKKDVDPVAVSQVAARATSFEGLSGKARKNAEKALAEVTKATDAHIKGIEKSLGKRSKGEELEDKPWIGHLHLFLRDYRGVPAAGDFIERWDGTVQAQTEATKETREAFWKHYKTNPARAFDAGVELVATGFLLESTADEDILGRLEGWREDAKDLGLEKDVVKAFDRNVPAFRSALEKGQKAFRKAAKRYS